MTEPIRVAVTGAAGASRRMVDGWSDLAQQHGAVGVLPLRRRDGEVFFQVKSVLTPGEKESAAEALRLADGDLALLVAGPEVSTSAALGALRAKAGTGVKCH